MSLFKLAVYGGIGYCVYQTFFAEMPASMSAGRSRQSGPSRSRQSEGGQTMTGRGKGKNVSTEDSAGTMGTHRVGRGVV